MIIAQTFRSTSKGHSQTLSLLIGIITLVFALHEDALAQTGHPTIMVQPQSVTITLGSNACFAVEVLNPTYYQWYKNDSAVLNATNSTLNVKALSLSEAANYFVVVTNSYGSVTSLTARLAVKAGNIETNYVFSTLAGMNGGTGHADGTGCIARFTSPEAVATDATGNIYVADDDNTIRKITPNGTVTTLAGFTGYIGSIDGTGSAARFNAPRGIAVDSSGNVFVTDYSNYTIRMITTNGVVTTIAGLVGIYGFANGTGNEVRFQGPVGLAVDSTGNLYVADHGNNCIRKISPVGMVTTIAGGVGPEYVGHDDGNGSEARFRRPRGVAVDSAGNVYVADTANHTLRKITPSGAVTTVTGTPQVSGSIDGVGSAALFSSPSAVTVDEFGNIYVADYGNATIRKVTSGGRVTTLAGVPEVVGNTDGPGHMAMFCGPIGVAVDKEGSVYVADSDNHTIRKITSAGMVTTLAGQGDNPGDVDGLGNTSRFNSPNGMAIDTHGNIIVADCGSTIRKIMPNGMVTTLAGMPGCYGSIDGVGITARFNYPRGVTVDQEGNFYVADTGNTIRKVTPNGTVTTVAGIAESFGSADGTNSVARFRHPYDVTVDKANNLYVADSGNNTIRKITRTGVVTTLAGLSGNSGNADGIGSAARFNWPTSVTVDNAGQIYVADYKNHTIRKVTSAGQVTTLAGLAGFPGSADGIGSAARFNFPRGVTVDNLGNVYVADYLNSSIRKIATNGLVSTIGGLEGQLGHLDGPGNIARFNHPWGIACDDTGRLFISDSVENVIRIGMTVESLKCVRVEQPFLNSRSFSLKVLTFPGKNYRLEYKESLVTTGWTTMPLLIGDGKELSLSDTNANTVMRYYRLRID